MSEGKVRLYLLRHADAGDPAAWRGDDDARPLSDKGVGQSERLGAHLASLGIAPGVIVASPRTRARQTAEIVAGALGLSVLVDDRLGGPLDPKVVAAIVVDAGGANDPMLVGHDPDFSELLSTLVGASGIAMKKGALAAVDVREALRPGAGTLRWLLPPELLGRGSAAAT